MFGSRLESLWERPPRAVRTPTPRSGVSGVELVVTSNEGQSVMSVDIGMGSAKKVKKFPLYRTLPKLVRDPLEEIQRISEVAGGEVLQLDLGASRPFVVTHPDHV